MSIRFDRESVQQFWQTKTARAGGAGGANGGEAGLQQALSDNQLSKAEYESLKQAFETAHPGQDFDRFLSDALDGQLDQQANPRLLDSLKELGRSGSAVSNVSLELTENRSGYKATPQAVGYEKAGWLDAVRQADGNQNGRLDRAELARAAGSLDPALRRQMEAEGAVLTFDTGSQKATFYPAPEAPTLHARYRDLKLELDVNLRDVDGIGDNSRNDLSGDASGELHFDWNGPLVGGIRQGVVEGSRGFVDVDARYVPAGDKDGYGPGYVIQLRGGFLATRPIVIKADGQGQLYLDSPGFGQTARLALGEMGLEKYALPQLKALGLDMTIENRDGRLYLRPQSLQVNQLPLSAQAVGEGQLNMGLGGHTRFSVASDGLRARFDRVPTTGSSRAQGPVAQPDRGPDGRAAPDTLSGSFRAGMNYNPQQQRLDVQVVTERAETTLHMDKGEIERLGYLPAEARQLAGEQVEGRLNLQGSYRTVNGAQHEGSLQGQIDLTSRQGDETTDVFTRFRTQPKPGQTSLDAQLSAVDVRRQRPGQEIRVRAESGQATTGAAGQAPQLSLQRVLGQAKISTEQLASARQLLASHQPGAAQLRATLQAAGISAEQLRIFSQGSDAQVARLLSTQGLAERFKQALVNAEASEVQLRGTAAGVQIDAEAVRLAGQAGDGQDTRVDFNAQAGSVSGSVGSTAAVEAREVSLDASLDQRSADGRAGGEITLQAERLNASQADGLLDVSVANGRGTGRVEAETASGTHLEARVESQAIQGRVQPTSSELHAGQTRVETAWRGQDGSRLRAEADLNRVDFTQGPDQTWTLQVPHLASQVKLEASLSELRGLAQQLGAENLADIARKPDRAQVQAALQEAGLSLQQATQTAELLWQPELHTLFATSSFVAALRDGRDISLEVRASGQLNAESSPAGVTLQAEGELGVTGRLQDAQGRELLRADVQADQVQGGFADGVWQAEAPALSTTVTGQRQDGTRFAELTAQAADFKARLDSEGTAVSTAEVSAEFKGDTRLDAEKIAEIQRLLGDFRDNILTRLTELGLNREQFEQILQAFGQQQLEGLFQALKPDVIAGLSADLGLSQEQIQQTLDLFSDAPFRKLVEDMFRFSDMLNNAEAGLTLQTRADSATWSQRDGQMLAGLQGISARLEVQTRSDNGQGQLVATGSQESLSYARAGNQDTLNWGASRAEAEASLQTPDGAHHLQGSATLSTAEGELTQQAGTIRSRFGATTLSGEMTERSADGSTGTAEGRISLDGVETRRQAGNPDSSSLQISGLEGDVSGTLQDPNSQQTVQGGVQGQIEQLNVRPRQMDARNARLQGQATSARDLGNGRRVAGEVSAEIQAQQLRSGAETGVEIADTRFGVRGETALSQNGEVGTRLGFAAENGRLQNLQADEGEVSADQIRADVSANLQTPMVRGRIAGELQADGLRSQDSSMTADTFRVDQGAGKVYIKTDRLRGLLASSPDALAILETLSRKWVSEEGRLTAPNLFVNDEISLEIDQARWEGDSSDGNALANGQTVTGRLRFPDLDTQLGSGQIEINLHNLSLANDTARPEVELTGTARFQPKQPAFNRAVQALVERNLQQVGVNLKPEVSFEQGQFRVKLDKWYVDGLIKVDFEGENIQLEVDKAKLLHFISARGLAARVVESQLNNYMLDVSREGNTLSLSLNEFSEQLLHKDNLQIRSVETRPDNSIHAQFAYTDTAAYNAAARQRSEQRLERQVFQQPTTGGARNSGDVEDMLEDLSPARLQKLFQEASPSQLRRMLQTVGNDYDNVLRKALAGQRDLRAYPVANRAIMAAYLSSNAGFLESVDSTEKALVRQLSDSVSAAQRSLWQRALQGNEAARIQAALAPVVRPRPRPQGPRFGR